MPTIYIDNQPYTFEGANKNLLEVCLSLGFNLPFFCWHPYMHAVGACRQCAVKQYKDEHDTKGKIVMACMTPAVEGARISINDPEASAFRAHVIEWLMINHPHDCPVCDEGGECHLQDMTQMTGHIYRKYPFTKRTYRNQHLGPFINHELNRCIQCYRCVRFYCDFAGGTDLDVFGCHDMVYFGRMDDGTLESEFSGNLVEVCPTGVFTDKTQQRHYTRKWDLQTAPNICVNCGLGCNIIPGERYGTLRRIRARFNGDVNGYFLCDRGRYGYEFVNSAERIRHPRQRALDGSYERITAEEALALAGGVLRGRRVIGIGSPRASLEANFALRTLVGEEHFFRGEPPQHTELVNLIYTILRDGPARTPSQAEVAQADAVLVLGEDLTNTAPMLDFAVRQAARREPVAAAASVRIPLYDENAVREVIQEERGPIFLATPWPTKLDGVAKETLRAAPDDIARLGFAVAQALDPTVPAVSGLADDLQAFAGRIATALKGAKRPVIIAGYGGGNAAVIKAAANVAWALGQAGVPAGLCYTVPESNSLGLAMLGGRSLADAVPGDKIDTAIILENDLYRALDAGTVDAFFAGVKNIIVLDHLNTATTRRAHLILPAGTFAESDGTRVNQEGRAQRFFQVFVPEGDIQESWRWLADLQPPAGIAATVPWSNLDGVLAALATAVPGLAGAKDAAPGADFRLNHQRVARQTHRFSGRTAIMAGETVHEPPPPRDPDAPMNFSMEGYQGEPPSALIPRFWAPRWNSEQAVIKFQIEVGGPLHGGNPGVRLLEPKVTKAKYFTKAPAAFTPSAGEWLVLPAYHIFGSEELSVLTPGVAERAPAPYLALSPADADRLRLQPGQPLTLTLPQGTFNLPVRVIPSLPTGLAAIPTGLPALAGLQLPAVGKVK